jgi:hypothetical protein
MSVETSDQQWLHDVFQKPAIIVDDETELGLAVVDSDSLRDFTDREGTLNRIGELTIAIYQSGFLKEYDSTPRDQRLTNVPIGRRHTSDAFLHRAFRTPGYSREYLARTAYGRDPFSGNEYENHRYTSEFIPQGIRSHIKSVLAEIFRGHNDMGDLDVEFLLDRDSRMLLTLGAMFINKPGSGDGVSSIRHIFKGDKNGGLHVPAYAKEITEPQVEPWKPFSAFVSIDGYTKLHIVEEDGNKRLELKESSMFPEAMDSLSVLQAIIEAWSHRRDSSSYFKFIKGNSRIYEIPFGGDANVGQHTMRIVTEDSHSERIRTAFPIVE